MLQPDQLSALNPFDCAWFCAFAVGIGATGCDEEPPRRSCYMKTLLKNLIRDDRGQDVIEYALLAAGISIIVIPTVPAIGTTVDAVYARISGAVAKI